MLNTYINLGWQRRPSKEVTQVKGIISPEEFYNRYIKELLPVVLRGAVKDVPAMTRWSKDVDLKKE